MAEIETTTRELTVEDFPATVRVIERRDKNGKLIEPGEMEIRSGEQIDSVLRRLGPHGAIGG